MSQTPSIEPIVRSKLLPRISFQTMLVLMGVSAIILAVAAAANQGGKYATAAALGVGFLLMVSATLSIVFLLAWGVAAARRTTGVLLVLASITAGILYGFGVNTSPLDLPTTGVCAFLVGLFLLVFSPPKPREDQITSPFAADQLPPQILPPRNPEP